MPRLPLLAFVLFLALLPRAVSAADCQFVLGFKEYRDSFNHAYIGECLENERTTSYGAAQRTTQGTLHWYRDGNYIDFVPNAAPTPTPKPTSVPQPTPVPQQESIACLDGWAVRALYVRSLWEEQKLTGYWRDLVMENIGEVGFDTYKGVCEMVRALGYTITPEFEAKYTRNRDFRHNVWCVIEPHLSDGGRLAMETTLSAYKEGPGKHFSAWFYYISSPCRKELVAAAQPAPTPEPTVAPTPTPEPYVDPRLEPAIRVMRTTETGEDAWRWFLQSGASMVFAALSDDTLGEYSPVDQEIRVAWRVQGDLPYVAAILVHEIVHAWATVFSDWDYYSIEEDCLEEELLATEWESQWWLEYYGADGRGDGHVQDYLLQDYLDDTLDDWVWSEDGYQEQCAA